MTAKSPAPPVVMPVPPVIVELPPVAKIPPEVPAAPVRTVSVWEALSVRVFAPLILRPLMVAVTMPETLPVTSL